MKNYKPNKYICYLYAIVPLLINAILSYSSNEDIWYIMKYGEIKKKKNDDTDTTEEEEHLKRIKQELLASLKRVEKLEELLFKKREEKIKLNVKGSKNGGFSSSKSLNEKETQIKKQDQKERE